MTRKLYSFVVVAAASGALIAGCGGSSSPGSTTTKTTPAKTTPASTTPTSTTPSTSIPAAELKAAAAGCKTAESHDTGLSSAAKGYLTSVCSDLESGNLAAFRSDAEKYCSAAIAAVPAADKALARQECKAIDNL
jgi:hypothetical protein